MRNKLVKQDFRNKNGRYRYCDKILHWGKDCRIDIPNQERGKRIKMQGSYSRGELEIEKIQWKYKRKAE